MANPEHLARLRASAVDWNSWRSAIPGGENASLPDLRGADLSGADLAGRNLFRADLAGAILDGAKLKGADFMSANLHGASLRANLHDVRFYNADLTRANLGFAVLQGANLSSARLNGACMHNAFANGALFSGADLTDVDLRNATLTDADFTDANLTRADLTGADITRATLVNTNLEGARLDDATVYGASVWKVRLAGASHLRLVVTPPDEPRITVDNLAVAQFIYLLLDNAELRSVIDTMTAKAVLILGRFTPERKAVLDRLREALRQHDYLPILFDFERPADRDITETVTLLARVARFIVADLTDPSSLPKELEAIAPHLAVPIQPLIEGQNQPFAMFADSWKYDWVLPVHRYDDSDALVESLAKAVIEPSEHKAAELSRRRAASALPSPT